MQANRIESIIQINRIIQATNQRNNVLTPKLADDIIQKPGKDKDYRPHYSRLTDSGHSKFNIKKKWSNKIIKSIEHNRKNTAMNPSRKTLPPSSSSEDTDTEPPRKRKWKQ